MEVSKFFCDEDGKPSFARVFTGLIVIAEIGWVSYLVAVNHVIPDMGGLVMFGGFLYTLNKAAGVMTSNKDDATKPNP